MRSACIFRYSEDLKSGQVPRREDLDGPHLHPFKELPTVESHVQPHFVICNIGLKLKKADSGFDHLILLEPRLALAQAIYSKWTNDIPLNDAFYKNIRRFNNDEDTNSDFTKQGRLDDDAYEGQGNRHDAAESTPSSRKRRRAGSGPEESDGIWLDDETLRELDENASPTKRFKKRMEMVSHWVSNVEFGVDIRVI